METSWVVIYYTDGTLPQERKFDNEVEAGLFWNDVLADPYKSGHSLLKVQVLARHGQQFGGA